LYAFCNGPLAYCFYSSLSESPHAKRAITGKFKSIPVIKLLSTNPHSDAITIMSGAVANFRRDFDEQVSGFQVVGTPSDI
jgi:hypothetical protein